MIITGSITVENCAAGGQPPGMQRTREDARRTCALSRDDGPASDVVAVEVCLRFFSNGFCPDPNGPRSAASGAIVSTTNARAFKFARTEFTYTV